MNNEDSVTDRDFFQLFGLKQQFLLDTELLRQRFIALQKKIHPDNFVGQTAVEKRLAIQLATQINDGYQVLQDPILRATYLAKIHGISIDKEVTYQADPEFLMQQMELRETLDELSTGADGQARQRYYQELKNKISAYHQKLTNLFMDAQQNKAVDGEKLKATVFELQFYQKIMNDFQLKFAHGGIG